MISFLILFLVGFVVSFLGSIPPGIINLTVMQLGIQHKLKDACHFTFGIAFIEFFYALAAVRFSELIRQHAFLDDHLDLLASVVLVSFGISNFISARRKKNGRVKEGKILSPFFKGALISLLNPMAITFWLGVTTYLLAAGFITFSGDDYFFYLIGIVLGTVLLLVLVAIMSKRFERLRNNKFVVYDLPGIIFLLMGLYSFGAWLSA